jgi:hypothetical protein
MQKLKIQASGWPSSIGDDRKKRLEYIQKYMDQYGIEINEDMVENNPGLKFLAKLMNNSMWGR